MPTDREEGEAPIVYFGDAHLNVATERNRESERGPLLDARRGARLRGHGHDLWRKPSEASTDVIQETIRIQSGAANVRPVALAGERADAAIRQLLGLEVGEKPQPFLQGHRRDVEDTG